MRILDENTREEITNPDLENGELRNDEQDIEVTYELIQKANTVYDEHVLPNGSIVKTINEEESTPEIGKWIFSDINGKYKEEDATGLENWSKTEINYEKEPVNLYHAYTQRERIEKNQRLAQFEQKRIKEAQNEQLLDELPEFEDDTDTAICDLYEMVEPTLNKTKKKSNGHTAIAKAYARRILRGEITLDDVPESIREEVRKILEENKK